MNKQNQSPINLDEQVEKILFDSIVALGVREEGTVTDLDTLIIDRQKAVAKLTKLISLQESKARISEVHKFLNRSDSLGESKYATRRIDQLNSNLSKGSDI